MSLVDDARKSLAAANAPAQAPGTMLADLDTVRAMLQSGDPVLQIQARQALGNPLVVDELMRTQRSRAKSSSAQPSAAAHDDGPPCRIHGRPFLVGSCVWCKREMRQETDIERIEADMALDNPMNRLAIENPKLHADILQRYPDAPAVDDGTRKVLADIGAQALDLQRQVDEVKNG